MMMKMKKTPFERAGFKPDDVFVVTEDGGTYYNEGDLAQLAYDDGTECPIFIVGDYFGKSRNKNEWHIMIYKLRKIGTL